MSNASEQVAVGRAGLRVCRLGFGCAPLGGLLRQTTEQDAHAAVHAALSAGLRYFDVAPQYGGGMAERRLGAALRPVPRDEVVLSSKVGKLIEAMPEGSGHGQSIFVGAPSHRIAYDYSFDGTMRSLDASLERLGTSRLDIVLIHDINRKYHGDDVMRRLNEALSGACRALRRLREQGAIGAYGCALNEIDVALRFVDDGAVDCIMLPQRYTLLDRSAESRLLPRCIAADVKVLVAGPFDSGILATGAVPDATYNYQPAPSGIMAQVRAMESVCRDFGVPLRAAALQFPLRHPVVASVVTGMRSPGEVNDNVAAMSLDIAEDLWPALESARVGASGP